MATTNLKSRSTKIPTSGLLVLTLAIFLFGSLLDLSPSAATKLAVEGTQQARTGAQLPPLGRFDYETSPKDSPRANEKRLRQNGGSHDGGFLEPEARVVKTLANADSSILPSRTMLIS